MGRPVFTGAMNDLSTSLAAPHDLAPQRRSDVLTYGALVRALEEKS